jgi:hypothetical protein
MSIPTQMSLAGFSASEPDLHFTSAGAEYVRVRVGVQQWRKEVEGSFSRLDPTFHDMVAVDKHRPGDLHPLSQGWSRGRPARRVCRRAVSPCRADPPLTSRPAETRFVDERGLTDDHERSHRGVKRQHSVVVLRRTAIWVSMVRAVAPCASASITPGW